MGTLENYITYFQKLIELEREEERKKHILEIRTLSGERREKLGRAILNLTGRYEGRGIGGTYIVKFSREREIVDTEISPGDVVLVSKGKPTGREVQGIVVSLTRRSIKVAFNNEPPRYVYGKNLRIDLFSNEITFQRMEEALSKLSKHPILPSLLLGKLKPSFRTVDEPDYFNENLNTKQREAVRRTLEANEVFIVHGPPGTGKTTTLAESIYQHVVRGYKVLAVADSNVAVDNLVEKLSRYPVKVVRIGHPLRMNRNILEHSLDVLIRSTEEYKQAEDLWNEVEQLKKLRDEHTYPSPALRRGLSNEQILKLDAKGKTKRGLNLQTISSMANWIRYNQKITELVLKAKYLEFKATYRIIGEADVVCATNSSAGSDYLRAFEFDVVFLDEATQSTEPSSLIPMVKGRKFILAGDHKQLPPTVLSEKAKPYLQYTLFERLLDMYGKDIYTMLEVQYRMNQAIMHFPNVEFYEGKLEAHESVKYRDMSELISKPCTEDYLKPERPVVFINVEAKEKQRKGSTSYYNDEEALIVKELVDKLLGCGLKPEHIGVISPYDDQVMLIRNLLEGYEGLEIKTVDGFQGREKEVIIISFVRANDEGNLGFLKDMRRLNVAITRAKRKLIMVGNASTLSMHPTYMRLIRENPYTSMYNLKPTKEAVP